MNFGSYVYVHQEPGLLARLYQVGLLPDADRRRAVGRLAGLAVDTPAAWLDDQAWQVLMTAEERQSIMESIRTELIPALDEIVEQLAGGTDEYDHENDPVEDTLYRYRQAFEEAGDADSAWAFEMARDTYGQLMSDVPPRYLDGEWEPSTRARTRFGRDPQNSARSIFDDVDE